MARFPVRVVALLAGVVALVFARWCASICARIDLSTPSRALSFVRRGSVSPFASKLTVAGSSRWFAGRFYAPTGNFMMMTGIRANARRRVRAVSHGGPVVVPRARRPRTTTTSTAEAKVLYQIWPATGARRPARCIAPEDAHDRLISNGVNVSAS